ncbi:MAG: hypothetical protein QNJ51_09780 [Calothrix sp. MO_167.B12]|nr:hypothetical protein [Calothrix sp. MO_167.B12]
MKKNTIIGHVKKRLAILEARLAKFPTSQEINQAKIYISEAKKSLDKHLRKHSNITYEEVDWNQERKRREGKS